MSMREPDEYLRGFRRRMADWRMRMQAKRAAKDAQRYEALSARPSRMAERMEGGAWRWPRVNDGASREAPAAVLEEGRTRSRGGRPPVIGPGEPSAASMWFGACVGLMIEGFIFKVIGVLMVRFFGFGCFLITLGAVLVVLSGVGMLLTPIVWIIDNVATAVHESRRPVPR